MSLRKFKKSIQYLGTENYKVAYESECLNKKVSMDFLVKKIIYNLREGFT